MTNCCDTYGNCNQGRDCPARKASKTAAKSPTPAEAGNVWFTEPEPPAMTWYEAIVIYSGLAVIAAGLVAALFVSAGYLYQRFFN